MLDPSRALEERREATHDAKEDCCDITGIIMIFEAYETLQEPNRSVNGPQNDLPRAACVVDY